MFSHQPPDETHHHALRIVRTSPHAQFVGISTSNVITGCCTHWYGGRTTPHVEGECEACNAGYSWRWHGYLSCLSLPTRQVVLFEFTAKTSQAFLDYIVANGTLRGCHFAATRPRNRPNGPVTILTKPADLQKWNLPQPADVEAILCHIWGIERPEIAKTPSNRTGDVLTRRAASIPDNGRD